MLHHMMIPLIYHVIDQIATQSTSDTGMKGNMHEFLVVC